jgi:REP element-mobilizing transposase RayT
MVFCIKYRRGLLVLEERCEYLKQLFKEIGERYWFELEEMGTDGDHVHITASLWESLMLAVLTSHRLSPLTMLNYFHLISLFPNPILYLVC